VGFSILAGGVAVDQFVLGGDVVQWHIPGLRLDLRQFLEAIGYAYQ
jgi:hypothetical protein